jgi:nickel-dependent lactate racemase
MKSMIVPHAWGEYSKGPNIVLKGIAGGKK